MRRIITLSTLSVVVTGILGGGVALADRGGEHRAPIRQPVRSPVRENRVEARRGVEQRVENRREIGRPIIHREPVRFDSRYAGHRYENGRYLRETIRERYFDYNVRPRMLIESFGAPVDGYVWVAGDWEWSGAEWIWVAGHYQAAY